MQGDYSEAAAAKEATGARFGRDIALAGDIAVKYLDHQQISAGASSFASLINAKSKEWDDTAKKADPNDPTVAQKFITENLEPTLEKFKSGFLTERSQQWAETHVDQFRQHMFAKTSADMATLAGHAAVVNSRQTINGLSNTVRGDPSSLDFSLRTLESSLGAMVDSSPNLRGTEAAKVRAEVMQKGKEEIVKSAALGYIEKTGEVPPWATDPKYSPYINGTELKQFAQAARYYERLGRSEERAARVQRDYEAKNDFNTKVNELEADLMPKNVGERPVLPNDYWDRLRALSKHPGAALEPGRLKSMVTQGEIVTARLEKPEPLARVSHQTTMDLLARIRAKDESRLTDNSAIYDEFQKGNLNNADFNFLNREFANLRSPEGVALEKDRSNFVKSFARLIDGKMNDAGVHSILGTQRMYEFEMDARRQEDVLRKKGLDPHLVYDPRSEYFWGKPENIAKYRVSLQEAQQYEKTLTAMDKTNADGASKPFVPPPTWQWSPSRKQYKDQSGQLYDINGKPVF